MHIFRAAAVIAGLSGHERDPSKGRRRFQALAYEGCSCGDLAALSGSMGVLGAGSFC